MKDQSFLLKNEQFSDVVVVIRLAAQPEGSDNRLAEEAPNKTGLIELAEFPGHMAILCQSDYFYAQAQFTAECHLAAENSIAKPVLTLTVEKDSHVPVVEAVIAVLYGVKDSLHPLGDCQLVHVVQYADMLQVESVAKEAASLLLSAAQTNSDLSADALHALSKVTWPDCLLPLLPVVASYVDSTTNMSSRASSAFEVVLSVLGSLEAVWASSKLSSMLLKLPLLPVEALLSSDKLLVYSEDTVMYTAARYVMAQTDKQATREAYKQLPGVVRAPHLSNFQLTAQAANDDKSAFNMMLSRKSLLSKLLTLRRLDPVSVAHVAHLLPTAPESWQLPARQILPVATDGVQLIWQVPVSKLVTAYNSCSETKRRVDLSSESVTAPISGTAWKLRLQCDWDDAGKGVAVGVYSVPAWCPQGVVYSHRFKIEGPGAASFTNTSAAAVTPLGWGWRDFFKLGTVQGLLEHSAWADHGLPVSGSFELRLTVYELL